MSIRSFAKKVLSKLGIVKPESKEKCDAYMRRYAKYAFNDTKCSEYEQYDAAITRWYHTIEKGLSYRNYRPGFGKDNIEKLLGLMESYARTFDTSAFFYETALSCLQAYVRKNEAHGVLNFELSERIARLPGHANDCGGAITVTRPDPAVTGAMSFEQLLKTRHSIREFTTEPVDVETLKDAIRLAQYTPSACNRQGWKTRIIAGKDMVGQVLACQNGNRGFGEGIDKVLLVTCDMRYFNRQRELYQPFIDGGMYAQNLINALYARGIGSIPLSASLTIRQEKKLRETLALPGSDVLILLIGVGNYPEELLAARSERRPGIDIEVIE